MSSIFQKFMGNANNTGNTGAPAPAANEGSAGSNPTVPNASNTPVATPDPNSSTPSASPLDKFQDLWKTDPNAKPNEPFSFNSDPAKLMDTAKTVDFTKVVSPDVMAAINKGGPEAQQAMFAAMNSMSQLTFAQASHAAAKITEAALQAQEQRFKDMLPTLIKEHSVQDSLKQDNPLMSDPALAPMIGALQSQFTKQYPNATSGEITAYVNEFLNGAADRIAGVRPKPHDSKARPEQDWGKLFGVS